MISTLPPDQAKGQSLVEYGLILALVAIVSLSGMTMLGGSISSAFQSMLGNSSTSTTAVAAAPSSSTPTTPASGGNTPAAPATTASTPPVTTATGANSSTMCTSAGGTCIDMSVVNMPTTQTAGAIGNSGMITAYSDSLDRLAQQLQLSSSSDPTLTNLITQLANKGHDIGNQQAVLATNPVYDAANTQINTYTAAMSDFETLQNKVGAYLIANPGALPPVGNQAVVDASNWISAHDHQFPQDSGATMNIASGSTTIIITNPTPVTTAATVPDSTHTAANTICANGGTPPNCIQ